MEEEQLINVTGKEFQIVGRQKRMLNCLILVLQKKGLDGTAVPFSFAFHFLSSFVLQFIVFLPCGIVGGVHW